jgi:Protein of unknown function (DUF2844)
MLNAQSRLIAPALVGALLVAVSGSAHATLGAGAQSVSEDQAAYSAAHALTPQANFDLHELTTPAGVKVREYALRGGPVFAVAWEGATTPDLKQLLGVHYQRFQSELLAHRTGHHVLAIRTPELVATVTRFQRTGSGTVYLPALVPSGTAISALR